MGCVKQAALPMVGWPCPTGDGKRNYSCLAVEQGHQLPSVVELGLEHQCSWVSSLLNRYIDLCLQLVLCLLRTLSVFHIRGDNLPHFFHHCVLPLIGVSKIYWFSLAIAIFSCCLPLWLSLYLYLLHTCAIIPPTHTWGSTASKVCFWRCLLGSLYEF